MVDQLAQARSGMSGGNAASGTDRASSASASPPFAGADWGGPGPLDGAHEPATASLVGSLSVFTLADVLSMLASTLQTGELQVVSDSLDGRVWLDRGELLDARVGTATTTRQAIFDLALLGQGWFYFTSGPVSTGGQSAVPVTPLLDELRPQVEEWQEILAEVPLEAVVTLCPDPPGQDVQIRNDQWRVLTTIGGSRLDVGSVLAAVGGDQIVGLRTLRDLHVAGLLQLGPASVATAFEPSGDQPATAEQDHPPVSGRDPAADPPSDAVAGDFPSDEPLGPSDDRLSPSDDRLSSLPPPPPPVDPGLDPDLHPSGLADVSIMPPPIAGDHWAASRFPADSGTNSVA
jgi:hypothetical protein